MFTIDENHFRRLVESSPDIVIAVDRKGMVIYYNDGARKNLGFTAEEIIGQNITRIYSSIEEARRVMKELRDSPDGGRIASFETVLCDKDGRQIPAAISGSLIYDQEGNEVGSIGFARDIRRMRQRDQLVTAGEIAVGLAHEINNPLESVINNLDLLANDVESHPDASERAIENARLSAVRRGIERIQASVRRLDEMVRKGAYVSVDYLQGRKMTDLGEHSEKSPKPDKLIVNGNAPRTVWPLADLSVLVLDDDETVVTSLADILRAERCVVHTATRPSAAFGIIRNVKINAVISDVVMPEMDGYEFYLKVKEELPKLPVILMTAYYYDKDHIIKRSRLEGVTGAIFKKPVSPAKLRELLAKIPRQPSPGKPHDEPS